MTDANEPQGTGELDPAIWDNPTLGAASNGVFLDVLEKQQFENRAAMLEERPAQIVKRENRYPGFEPDASKPDVEFGTTYEDGSKVIPVLPAPPVGYEDQGKKFDEPKTSTASTDKVSSTGKTATK